MRKLQKKVAAEVEFLWHFQCKKERKQEVISMKVVKRNRKKDLKPKSLKKEDRNSLRLTLLLILY